MTLLSDATWLEQWGFSADGIVPRSAYIHIPFCRQRCGYCNFSLLANRDDLFDRFLDGLERELQALEEPRPVETLFIGGGTPTILPDRDMHRLLAMLTRWLPLAQGGEWSIEANPLDITRDRCQLLAEQGVNRLSIGGQSFQGDKLRRLERDHSPDQLGHAIAAACQTFDRVSLDLIFAAPDESLDGWMSDLAMAIESGVGHISTYGLTYEKGAKFWGRRERNELASLDESIELAMYQAAIAELTFAGFEHYEISNFAKPGAGCRHNQTYWNGEPWWAFGPSAARYLGKVRSVNHRGTLVYIKRIEGSCSPVDEIEILSPQQQLRERFVFGMRMLCGVHWDSMAEQADRETRASIQHALERHVDRGWMTYENGQVRLTHAGLVISDSLWSEYL